MKLKFWDKKLWCVCKCGWAEGGLTTILWQPTLPEPQVKMKIAPSLELSITFYFPGFCVEIHNTRFLTIFIVFSGMPARTMPKWGHWFWITLWILGLAGEGTFINGVKLKGVGVGLVNMLKAGWGKTSLLNDHGD